MGCGCARGLRHVFRSWSGISWRCREFLSLPGFQNPSLAPFPLSQQNAAPPAFTIQSTGKHDLCSRSSFKAAADVSVESRVGPVDQKQIRVLSLTYIGAIGRDLLRATQFSNPNPNFQSVILTDNSATSDYHAMQVKFQRRLSRGLQVISSYTFSHSIDIASTDATNNFNTVASIAAPNVDRGNSDFDIRHSFTAGSTYVLPFSIAAEAWSKRSWAVGHWIVLFCQVGAAREHCRRDFQCGRNLTCSPSQTW